MKKKRKLIDPVQEHIVVCDNPACDYKLANPTKDPRHEIENYLNKPCPECGQNLLTKRDLDDYMRMLKVIDWINKWFGWLMFFVSDKPDNNTTMSIHVHDGKYDVKKEKVNTN